MFVRLLIERERGRRQVEESLMMRHVKGDMQAVQLGLPLLEPKLRLAGVVALRQHIHRTSVARLSCNGGQAPCPSPHSRPPLITDDTALLIEHLRGTSQHASPCRNELQAATPTTTMNDVAISLLVLFTALRHLYHGLSSPFCLGNSWLCRPTINLPSAMEANLLYT